MCFDWKLHLFKNKKFNFNNFDENNKFYWFFFCSLFLSLAIDFFFKNRAADASVLKQIYVHLAQQWTWFFVGISKGVHIWFDAWKWMIDKAL